MNCLLFSPQTNQAYLPVPIHHSPARLPARYRSHDHRHRVYHLVFIQQGTGQLETDRGAIVLQPGSVLCIDPEKKHIFVTRRSPLAYYAFNFYLVPLSRTTGKKITPALFSLSFLERNGETEPLHRLFALYRNNGLLETDASDWPGITSHINHFHTALETYTSSLTPAGPGLSAPHYLRYLYQSFTFLSTVVFTLVKGGHTGRSEPEPAVVRQIRTFLRQHPDRPFRLSDLSGATGYHPAYLSAYFKKTTGQTLNAFVNIYKTAFAARLLETTDLSVTDIALKTGFSSSQHLAMRFKEQYGISPRRYRARAGTI